MNPASKIAASVLSLLLLPFALVLFLILICSKPDHEVRHD